MSPWRLLLPRPHRRFFRDCVRPGESTVAVRNGHRTALRFTSHIALFFVFHEFSVSGDSDPVMSVRVYEFPKATGAFDDALDVVDGTRESDEAEYQLWFST